MKPLKTKIEKLLSDNNYCDGFTLIELIMTIVIISIAILSMMNLSSSILVKSNKSSVLSYAVALAEEKMEAIRADKKNSTRGYDWIITPNNYDSESLPNGFTRSVIVDASNSHNGIPYALIQVVIQHSQMEDYILTTWMTDY